MTSSRRPSTAPPTTLPWPSRYFVAEWITRSAPSANGSWSAGVQKQLSTASSAPERFATSASAAMSAISVSGFEGVSRNRSRVDGRTARRHASASAPSTNVVSTPNFVSTFVKSCTVAPKMLDDETMWSPPFISPITQARIAAMPEAVATQASAPSSAASRSWNAATVGLLKRE